MTTAASNHPADWLASLPDPIPEILDRWARAKWAYVLVAAASAVYFVALHEVFTFPEGWLFHLIGILLSLGAAGSIYARSLDKGDGEANSLEFITGTARSAVTLMVAANVLWTLHDYFNGMPGSQAPLAFGQRILNLPEILGSNGVNLLQIGCLIAFRGSVSRTLRSVLRARRFEKELAPRKELRLARTIAAARKQRFGNNRQKAEKSLSEARSILRELQGKALDRGLVYHRKLMLQHVVSLEGGEISRSFLHDAFEDDSLEQREEPFAGSAPRRAARKGEEIEPPSPPKNDAGYGAYLDFIESLKTVASTEWADVAGLDAEIADLKTSFALALAASPAGVKIDPPRTLLLYGPPGTGKTLLVAAISRAFKVPFLNVKVSDVLSKYFGESPRLVSAIYAYARDHAPSIIFFDEVESLTADRSGNGGEGEERRILSTLLAELDGLASKGDPAPVFTIAATNVPWEMDPAILSRFEKHFYIGLPRSAARRQILELNLTKRGFKNKVPIEALVQHTRGYTGREMRQLCSEVVRYMLSQANPELSALVDKGKGALEKYKVGVAPISGRHWNYAFRKIRPKTDEKLLAKYDEWLNRA